MDCHAWEKVPKSVVEKILEYNLSRAVEEIRQCVESGLADAKSFR
ncbi:MAG: hypothetical protein ACLT4D_14435 [Blautia faecis]